ncbi:unnamed protein product, partial [Cyprideis torosa]
MTGAGMMDCKKALTETNGDMEKAVDLLRQKGLAVAAKRAGRATSEGVIATYIHGGGKLGVMVEVGCETDFVAKTDQFQDFARDIAMHIAAANPVSVSREEVPEDVVAREKEIYIQQALDSGKPAEIAEKMVHGVAMQIKYKRILLKLSGEALMGEDSFGINTDVIAYVAREIKGIISMGVEPGLVIGAGNIFRGVAGASRGMDRATADNMGMLATVMNSLALQDALERTGVDTRVMSAIPMQSVCEPYIRRRATRHLEKGRAVIFAAGTGNPYFTTDSAGVLRALEIDADLIIKATKVDGVYDKDPVLFDDAIRYERLDYEEVLIKGLKVMDAAGIALARDDDKPIMVLNM